jgi:nucleotide-binding universal stress UspA family protein
VFQDRAEAFVAEAVQAAGKVVPGITVTGAVTDGPAVPVLLSESQHADLMVLGDRGLGGFAGLILGSVAVQMATHGACPVLVVRGTRRSTGPVVVGIDGSRTSARAFDFAVEEAALRRTDVVAVHTWQTPPVVAPGDMMPLVYEVAVIEEEERRVLAEAVAGVAERYPEVGVRQEVVHAPAAHHLAERSADAQLVVVGDRGHGGFVGLLLGSVSQYLIHHCACPVAVVRAEHDRH